MSREQSWPNLSLYSDIFVKGLRNTKENLSQYRPCSGRYSNEAQSEYMSEVLPLELKCKFKLRYHIAGKV
jgi:hypothetical protein